jgi:hypothetical protein
MLKFDKSVMVNMRAPELPLRLEVEDPHEAMVMMNSGRLRDYRYDDMNRERPIWRAAFEATQSAIENPTPEALADARTAFYRLSMYAQNV